MKCVEDITNIIKNGNTKFRILHKCVDKALTGLRELTSFGSSAMGKGISNNTTQTDLL